MADKRMFSLKIVDSDLFLDMPLSSQCLYFHLSMRADDDGFVDNPKKIIKIIGANEDDLKILITKGFVIVFERGIIFITHWKINNFIRKDRYKPTMYIEQKQKLYQTENWSIYFRRKNKLKDLDRAFEKLYEDRLSESISERNFNLMNEKLSKQQEEVIE